MRKNGVMALDYVPREEEHGGIVEPVGLVFVHGLFSSPETWDPLVTLLKSDEKLQFVSPLLFAYASPKIRIRPDRRIPDFDDLADRLKTFLEVKAQGYERLVLVAHSQGGLVIQRHLARMLGWGLGQDLARIKAVVLFACPNDGSEFALSLRKGWWQLNPQERGLRTLSESVKDAQRTVLRQAIGAKELGTSTCPIPFWVYGGEKDNVVKRASAQAVFPNVGMLPGDHNSIIQPASDDAEVYLVLRLRLLEAGRAEVLSARTPQQLADAVQQISNGLQEAVGIIVALPAVEKLLHGLGLDEHDKAERRVNEFFTTLPRHQQRAAVEAMIQVATTTEDDTTQLLACSLVEAVGRLDPMLIKVEDLEGLAGSEDDSLRSTAAVLMGQWAESIPGQVPIPLLGRLAQPSTQDWYVHAAARAGAKQLLLRRAAARAIFDGMAASDNQDDRDYAVEDLLEVAEVEPRAIPADLALTLAGDQDSPATSRGAELLRVVDGVDETARRSYYGRFGM